MSQQGLEKELKSIQSHSMGLHGHYYSGDAEFANKRYIYLIAIADSTITYTVYDDKGRSKTHTSKALEKNQWIVGDIRDVSVASGTILGYLQENNMI